jgi:predicted type IV restriction endonuclease
MAFEDALEDIAGKVKQYSSVLSTEEATKTAIIMPFISRVLGYDIFNPSEVVPEFVADLGLKRGEKIDFAIMKDGDVQILIEAKKIGEELNLAHAGQLVRYFHTSNARISILTNGQHWHFFTDLDRPNVMDEKPFLRLDLLNIDPYTLPELKKLTKDAFDLESVLLAAEDLKYVSALKRTIAELFVKPSDDFVRLLASRVHEGALTAKVRELFTGLTQKALAQFINDEVNDRLKTALRGAAPAIAAVPDSSPGPSEPAPGGAPEEAKDDVVTTIEEMEGFHIVRAILASDVPYARITPRDTKSYFGILLDDNNRKQLCRLHFNRKQKYLGLIDAARQESRVPIDRVEDIYMHAEALRATARSYV